MTRLRSLLLLPFLALPAALALAQEWPEKPIKIIVSTPAGTSPDRIARIVADRLSKDMNAVVIAQNMPGGGGLIATRAAVRSEPDGYTLFFAGMGALIIDPLTRKDLGYDPEKDLDLISYIYQEGSLSIVVHPDVPATTLPELLALAKKQPGKLNIGTTQVTFLTMFAKWINHLGGVQMTPVAYKRSSTLFQDALAGRIEVLLSSPPSVDPHRKSGKLRVLAIDGSTRYPPWPDVPNISDTFPGFRLSGLGVLAAPAGIPDEAKKKLRASMERIVDSKDYHAQLLRMGFTVENAGTQESMRNFLAERRAAWEKVVQGLKIEKE